ncbi:MAG: dihydrodipicolinate synthase family protein, partial [Pirellulales bacterium]
GILPVLHTPLGDDESIDRAALCREIDWVFALGVDGICSAMVSEVLRLTERERGTLVEAMVEGAAGRGSVIASVGAESTRQAVLLARDARRAGCDAVMAVPPIATALPPPALRDYYGRIADSIDRPLIVQDASGYVGQSMTVEFLAELLEAYGPEKVLFKPEASPVGPRLSELRDRTGGRARIFEGSGGIFLIDSFRRGIAGTMPGVDLLDGIVALWRALGAGNDDAAYRLALPIGAIVAMEMQAGLDGFLAIEKYILVRRGIFVSDRRRTPYAWSLDQETAAEIDRLLLKLEEVLHAMAGDQGAS